LTHEAVTLHWQYHRDSRTKLAIAKAAGDLLLQVKQSLVDKFGAWGKWLQQYWLADASRDTAERYVKIAEHWDKLERLMDADPKLSINEALDKIRTKPEPGGNSVVSPRGTVTANTRERTAAEEARYKLDQMYAKTLRYWSPEELIYLVANRESYWDSVWEKLEIEVRQLAHIIVPAQERCRAALLALGPLTNREEGAYDAHWAQKAKVEATYRLDILKGLADIERLSPDECGIVLWELGIHRCDDDDPASPLREEDLAELAKAIKPVKLRGKLIAHLRQLLEEQDTAKVGNQVEEALASA
jgi:hypothetical protein